MPLLTLVAKRLPLVEEWNERCHSGVDINSLGDNALHTLSM